MKLTTRKLSESDWDTLKKWWSTWKDWVIPPKDFLPDNGTGGIMVVKDNKPIVAGFLYFTNSKAVLLEWIISDPEYRQKDRKKAIELLILTAEKVCVDAGKNYIFSIGRNSGLINTHKKLNYKVDKNPSYEIIKKIN